MSTSDTRVIGSNSYGTAYTYDPAGNILTETYPSGRIVAYTRDALGRICGHHHEAEFRRLCRYGDVEPQ